MNIALQAREWRQVAIVEVADDAMDFAQLVADDTLHFRSQPAANAPTGYHWYEILVDTSGGDRRVARTAWAILTALKRSSETGLLDGFRIVNGQQWLTMGDNNAAMGVDGMTPGNRPNP